MTNNVYPISMIDKLMCDEIEARQVYLGHVRTVLMAASRTPVGAAWVADTGKSLHGFDSILQHSYGTPMLREWIAIVDDELHDNPSLFVGLSQAGIKTAITALRQCNQTQI